MYYLFLFGKALALILPRRSVYAVAEFLALIHWFFSAKDRQAVEYNLSNLIEDKAKIKESGRQVFINFALYLVDFFRYSRLNKKFVDKFVRVTGIEYLRQACDEGKGVITLTAHLGNYELGGAVISLLGFDFNVVALPHKDKRVNDFFNHQRQRVGMKVIAIGSGIKRCYSQLKSGKIVGLLGDRDFSGTYLNILMGNKIAPIPKGPAFFALKTQAAVIPGFLIRENRYYYNLIFDQPIKASAQDTQESLTIKYAAVIEKYLRLYPQQWYVFTKYWQEPNN